MKTVLIALLILVVIIWFSLFYYSTLARQVDLFLHDLNLFEEHIKNKNYEEANELFLEFEEKWGKKEDFISIMMEHSELDEINRLIMEVKGELDSTKDPLSPLYQLNFFLEHMIKKNKLDFFTIF